MGQGGHYPAFFLQEALLYSCISLSISVGSFSVLTLSVMALQASQPAHCAIVVTQ